MSLSLVLLVTLSPLVSVLAYLHFRCYFNGTYDRLALRDAARREGARSTSTVFDTDGSFTRFLADPRSPRFTALGERLCCTGTVCRHTDTYAVLPLDVV